MKTKSIIALIFEITGLLLALWAVIRLGIHVYHYLTYPLPLDDGEGHVLNQAMLIASGKLPYHSIDIPPYIVTNYPPLYAALAALFFPLLGEFSLFPDTTVFPGLIVTRFISVLSGLGISYLIYKVALKSGANRDSAAINSFLFLAMPIVYFWFSIGKPDMLALFLGLTGLYVALVNIEKGKLLYLSLIPLILAVFSRQSEIAPFCAIALYLVIKKDRRVVPFILLYVVASFGITLVLQITSGGEYLKHIVTYTKTQYLMSRLFLTWNFFFRSFSLVLLVAFFQVIRDFASRNFKIAHMYFIFAFLVSLTSGKVGSDMNYFLETIIAGHIVLAVMLNDGYRVNRIPAVRVILAGLVFLIALDFAFIHDNRIYSYQPNRDDVEFGATLVSIIKRQPGPILSEDEAFAAVCGKEVIFNPFIMSELSKEGLWDQTEFVNSINNQVYDLLILRFDITKSNHEDKPSHGGYAGWDRWTEEMEEAIKSNYTHFATIPLRRPWYLYFPLREKDTD